MTHYIGRELTGKGDNLVQHKHEAMKQIISDSGKSVIEWSILTGVSRQHIYRWINGETKNVRSQSLEHFARIAGYTVEWENYDRINCNLVKSSIKESNEMDLLKEINALQKEKIKDLERRIKIYES